MIGLPTSTVSPSAASSSVTVPANGDGSSTSDLAVSISTRTWFTVTVSPGLTFHWTISASVRPSPTSGSGNSDCVTVCSSVGQGPVDGLQDAVGIREVDALELGGRERGVEAADPQHRRLERVEGALGDRGGDLGSDT